MPPDPAGQRRHSSRARERFPRRQVHAGTWPHLYQRHAGVGTAADAAAGTGSRRGSEHCRLHLRLSRVAARRARPVALESQEASCSARRRVPGRPERRPCRHLGVGLPAGQHVSGCQVRWRIRHVVRQGPGRGPHRRRLQARQLRRLHASTAACWCWPATTIRPSPPRWRTSPSTSSRPAACPCSTRPTCRNTSTTACTAGR